MNGEVLYSLFLVTKGVAVWFEKSQLLCNYITKFHNVFHSLQDRTCKYNAFPSDAKLIYAKKVYDLGI